MKIKIEDFGPIKEFTFDTEKKFHLIVGENNVGKSYALTAYYFVLKSLLEFESFSRMLRRQAIFYSELAEAEHEAPQKEIDSFSALIKDKKSGSVSIDSFYKFLATELLQHTVADEFSKKIKSSYLEHNSIANNFSRSDKAKISVSMHGLSFILEGDVDQFRVTDVHFNHEAILRFSKQNRSPILTNGKLVIYALANDKPKDLISKIRMICSLRISSNLSEAIGNILSIDYLPASRSGLYQALSAFGQIIAELSKSRSFLSSKIELPGIPGQLSDYFIKLTNIVSSDKKNENFEQLAKNIENDVLNGQIEFDFDEKKLFYRPSGTTLRLDISSTSSMVSETAPIVTYIRHIIAWDENTYLHRGRRKPLNLKKVLIIEEPEAHLHPKNQIKMTSFYADLAQMGVSVIMTSHSNYVFNKASNLVIQGTLPSSDVKCDLFRMEDNGSRGIPQSVDEFGIDDENFGDASEDLINDRLELLADKDCRID